ncbi:MAG: hypothetical protein U1D06_00950, partial [Paracoccaceae bacterium]|nr:hypothetical protein [Paracoccaceae bacterium]
MMDASTTVPARSFKLPLTLGFVVVAAIAGYAGYSQWGGQAQSFGPIGSYVYVQSLGAPEITLIDTSDDTVAGTITLPVHPDQVLVAKDLERIIYS